MNDVFKLAFLPVLFLSARIERFVAKLQQRDREVLRAEQLAALGQLAAGVAHEVRNPLTSIKLLVQAELESSTRGGMAPEDLRIIESEVQRMERSLQSFLDYARLTEPEQKRVDFETIVENVMGLVRVRAARQRVDMQRVSPEGGVPVSADVNQMQQVVLNLALARWIVHHLRCARARLHLWLALHPSETLSV